MSNYALAFANFNQATNTRDRRHYALALRAACVKDGMCVKSLDEYIADLSVEIFEDNLEESHFSAPIYTLGNTRFSNSDRREHCIDLPKRVFQRAGGSQDPKITHEIGYSDKINYKKIAFAYKASRRAIDKKRKTTYRQ